MSDPAAVMLRLGLFLLLIVPRAHADAPDWTVDASAYSTSMTVTAAVGLGHTAPGPGDVLGIYARDTPTGLDVWRGVGEPVAVGGTLLFLLTVYGETDGEALYLRYYDASADEVYRTSHTFIFEANRVFGTIATPLFIDRFMREAGAPAWSIDAARFDLSMAVTARVEIAGVTATTQDRLAAFSNGALRGVATPAQVGTVALFYMTVYAAEAQETIDFRLYDASADTVYAVHDLLAFQANSRQGTSTAPVTLRARTQPLRPAHALQPVDGEEGVSAEVTLRWRPDPAAMAYRVQIGTDAQFSGLLYDTQVEQAEFALPLLDYGRAYHWRVQSRSGVDAGAWAVFQFHTATGVAREADALAPAFTLEANHPNPFPAQTHIAYTLAAPDRVVLTIHDLLGREVARLHEGYRAAGIHQARFDATHQPSGVYLYRLQAGTHTVTRTMTVLK